MVIMIVGKPLYQYMIPIISVFLLFYSLFLLFRRIKEDKELFTESGRSYKILLVIILVLGVLIRFFAQYFSYHPQYMYSAIANTIYETGRIGFCTLEFNYCFPTYKPYTVYVSLLGFLYRFLDGVSFTLARNLNVFFGTLTIPLSYMVSKKYLGKDSAAIIFASLLAFLPLHVELSKSMETHVFSIFFVLAFFLFLKEFFDTGEIDVFGGALMMYLMAVLSKPLNLLLIIPLGYVFWKKDGLERIKNFLSNGKVVFSMVSGLFFIPIYHFFLFRQGVLYDVGLAMFQDNQLSNLLIHNNFYVLIGLLSFSGLVYAVVTKKYFVLAIFVLYFAPLLVHTQNKPVRLILPALITTLFIASDLLDSVGEKIFGKNLQVYTALTIILISTLFFYNSFYPSPYRYFNEEDVLDEELSRISDDYEIYSQRADLAYSVSTERVHNINFGVPDFQEKESVAILKRGMCDEKPSMLKEELRSFEVGDGKEIGGLYSICIYKR